MTIQRKFIGVLVLVVAIVGVGLGSAMFFARVLERELVEPFQGAASVLQDLATYKRDVGDLTAVLPGPGRDERGRRDESAPPAPLSAAALGADREEYAARLRVAELSLAQVMANPDLAGRMGISTSSNLRRRASDAAALAAEWFETGDPAMGVRAGDAHYEIHELIEAAERFILRDVSRAAAHGEAMRRIHGIVLAAGAAATALVAVLAVALVRRWIVRPVALLRRAAAEIAKGNFDYRVAIETGDEMEMLGDEVNHMASTIRTMQNEAVERERLAGAGEMLRRLAHNIRNPLAGIRGVAELTRRRAPDGSPIRADQTEIIEAVDRFNLWLTELLSATSPLDVRPIEAEPKEWLEAIAAAHAPLARARNVSVRLDLSEAPVTARFDPRRLEHAVVAVVTNAIQASPEGGQVTLRASSSEEDGCWQVAVSDQGPGIPAEIRDRIFRPYFTTKRDGNGIGLASALQVVRAHGGVIDVETAPGAGTTFRLRLPLASGAGHSVVEISQSADISQNGATPRGNDPGHRG